MPLIPVKRIALPLSGNALKIIAAVSMLVDHIGFLFFPQIAVLRVIGRLAYPIFAFMIAEGCRYTRNRIHYFLSVFVLGVICQLVYSVAGDGDRMNILLTFSLSIALICLLQQAKKRCGAQWWFLFAGAVAAVWYLTEKVWVDYGFWGVMTPVLVSAFQPQRGAESSHIDRHLVHVGMLGIGLTILAYSLGGIQWSGILALPLLLLYSGKRGSWNLKYFFYLFYPLHLALLQIIAWLLV